MRRISLFIAAMLLSFSVHAVDVVNDCNISWIATISPDVDGYRLLWGTDPSAMNNVFDTGNTDVTSTCSAAGITVAGDYFMTARAYNRGGESGDSNQENFIFLVILAPAPPTSLIVGG